MAQAHEAVIAWAEVLLCQLEVPLVVVRWALETARRHEVPTILNPAPAQSLGDEILAPRRLSHPERGRGERPVRPTRRGSRLGARGGRAPGRAGRRARARHPRRPWHPRPRRRHRAPFPRLSHHARRYHRRGRRVQRRARGRPRRGRRSRASRPARQRRRGARLHAARSAYRAASRRTCCRSAGRRRRPAGGVRRALPLGHADPQPVATRNGPESELRLRQRAEDPVPRRPARTPPAAAPRLTANSMQWTGPRGPDSSAGGGRGACRRGRWRRGLACARRGPS